MTLTAFLNLSLQPEWAQKDLFTKQSQTEKMRNFPHLESAKNGSKILQNEEYVFFYII